MYYKLGQACERNWGRFFLITNQGKRCYNLGQFCHYKLGQLLQIRAIVITREVRIYYNMGQDLLQVRAGITNQGSYYKLGYNLYHENGFNCFFISLVHQNSLWGLMMFHHNFLDPLKKFKLIYKKQAKLKHLSTQKCINAMNIR